MLSVSVLSAFLCSVSCVQEGGGVWEGKEEKRGDDFSSKQVVRRHCWWANLQLRLKESGCSSLPYQEESAVPVPDSQTLQTSFVFTNGGDVVEGRFDFPTKKKKASLLQFLPFVFCSFLSHFFCFLTFSFSRVVFLFISFFYFSCVKPLPRCLQLIYDLLHSFFLSLTSKLLFLFLSFFLSMMSR